MTAARSSWRWSADIAPATALIVVTRRIGDVLLATPLVRSLKRAWPHTAIDALVFAGTEAIIAANPDLRRVHTIAERAPRSQHLAFIASIARRYDLALSLVPSDRPTGYAFVAGRSRAGLLLDTPTERWKRLLLDRWQPFDPLNTHTVRMHLALASFMGIPLHADPVVSWTDDDSAQAEGMVDGRVARYAVLHPYPKFNYKMWVAESWMEIASWLTARGYRIVLTGGPEPAEVGYVSALASRMSGDVANAAGRLTLGASLCLVSRAALYVGPDTALTHAAAALGVPTIALYGPTDPVKWGPWPRGHDAHMNPWRRYGTQRTGNVTLVQGVSPCVPCLDEGCEKNTSSFSDCLQQLPSSRVIRAMEGAHALPTQSTSAAA
ncbi:MAG TPA: glycosyltransferase family 9 protein [Burkholderiales bacterium]|nr:glycosyltransferase family 9 protein [Burkholderiales bacterium]